MAHAYIVRCADGTLYTGSAKDLDKRIAMHNNGKGAKYTRGRTPVHLVYSEVFATLEKALRREAEIKRLSRSDKDKLIESKK
jgi:putative endonuclease